MKSIGTLYITATPIGNLADWTFRAVETAKSVNCIACEDTRVTGVLLRHYGIATKTVSYHEHNAETVRPQLLARLAEGKNLALMTDAGTPLISDPGYRLVRAAQEAGADVVSVPGASSPVAALSIAGLPTDAFYFAGFPPHKAGARRKAFLALRGIPATLVFFESANRLTEALADALEAFGDREICVCREMTKRFEEARRGKITEILAHYAAYPPKGEIVLLVAAGVPEKPDEAELDALLRTLLVTHRLKEAVAVACEQTGLPRKEVYARALALPPS